VWIIVSIILLLIAISLIYDHFFAHNVPTLHQEKQKVKEIIDSNTTWKKQWMDIRYRDSIDAAVQIAHMDHIDAQVQRIPQMIQQINTRTNAQIHNITLLSTDQQFALFANWISETDSL
jgi:CHASE3 domain sensor protein